jgi:hypothetical protein
MSYSEAVVTGFIFASCTAIMNYVVNRLVIRPLDRNFTEFEKWAKEKLALKKDVVLKEKGCDE